MKTKEIEEIVAKFLHENFSTNSYSTMLLSSPELMSERLRNILTTLQTKHAEELERAVEEERERILENILKWSTTATVIETTGREGAKRATEKLRDNLAGCYHFLYQALRLTPTQNITNKPH